MHPIATLLESNDRLLESDCYAFGIRCHAFGNPLAIAKKYFLRLFSRFMRNLEIILRISESICEIKSVKDVRVPLKCANLHFGIFKLGP